MFVHIFSWIYFRLFSFSAIRCKSLLWRLTFSILRCKPFVEYFFWEISWVGILWAGIGLVWNSGGIMWAGIRIWWVGSGTIQPSMKSREQAFESSEPEMKSLAGILNLLSRHKNHHTTQWAGDEISAAICSNWPALESLQRQRWNHYTVSWRWNICCNLQQLTGAGTAALASVEITTQWADDEISVAICSNWPALESLQH